MSLRSNPPPFFLVAEFNGSTPYRISIKSIATDAGSSIDIESLLAILSIRCPLDYVGQM